MAAPIFSFGDWLQKWRKTHDLTREELAQRVGCSISALRKIETDQRRPSKQLAQLLAECLVIPTEERANFIKAARGELVPDHLPIPVFPPTPPLVPITASSARISYLPAPITSIIGREAELSQLEQLLLDPVCRLVTLVGPGGIGKTRLAIEAASKLIGAFADGAAFIPLAPISSTDQIIPAIVKALGFQFYGMEEPKELLFNHLRDMNILLVLDDFEHLLDGAGLFIGLLKTAPGVKLLFTSREQINLEGEWLFEVKGLKVPQTELAEGGKSYSSVALFLQCARRVCMGFTPKTGDWPEIISICQLTEGIPLAIELAATWMRTLSCAEIAREIEQSMDFLATPGRDLPERHRSMRAVFDYSWRMLADEEQRALQQLSVFRGGFIRNAAEQVTGTSLPVLSSLVSKSLLRRHETGRYDLHGVIRQYALEKIRRSGILDETCRRHLSYFVSLATEAQEQLRGPQQVEWFNRLGHEHDNIRAALEWAFAPGASPEQVEAGLCLVASIYRYWPGRGHVREGIAWLERGLHASNALSPFARAHALRIAGWLVNHGDDSAYATRLLKESVDIYQQLGDEAGLAEALDTLGDVAWRCADFEGAKDYYEESLALYRKGCDPRRIGLSLASIGRLHVDYGHYPEAETYLMEALSLLENASDLRSTAYCLNSLGRLALFMGDMETAALHLRRALRANNKLGYLVDITEGLQEIAVVKAIQGDEGGATRLWAAANALQKHQGITYPSNDPLYLQAPAAWVQAAHSMKEWAEGETMPFEEVIARALGEENE